MDATKQATETAPRKDLTDYFPFTLHGGYRLLFGFGIAFWIVVGVVLWYVL